MKIEGAIFDCDGTLVDSMGMWFDLVPNVLEEYGVKNQREFIDSLEDMSISAELEFLHDKFEIDCPKQEFIQRAFEILQYEYTHNIKPFEGVKEFLEQLYQEGIPMVVASSTTSDDVRLCLKACGLDKYFKDVIYAGDIGRSKSHPDIYYYALGRLGTPKESTWVFEDAPFGVTTSHKAGFPNVCIHNDHDGRDAKALKPYATILSHEWQDVSLNAIKEL